jgi:hypothetical protein
MDDFYLEKLRLREPVNQAEIDRFYGDFRLDLLHRVMNGEFKPGRVAKMLRDAMPTFPQQSGLMTQEAEDLDALIEMWGKDAWLPEDPKRPNQEYASDYAWRIFAGDRERIAAKLAAEGTTPKQAYIALVMRPKKAR